MKISVTQEHINEGQKRVPTVKRSASCPVSRALQDHFGIPNIEVAYSTFHIGTRVFGLPNDVREFIYSADDEDNQQTLQPFEFEI